jgi:hypothetical protein
MISSARVTLCIVSTSLRVLIWVFMSMRFGFKMWKIWYSKIMSLFTTLSGRVINLRISWSNLEPLQKLSCSTISPLWMTSWISLGWTRLRLSFLKNNSFYVCFLFFLLLFFLPFCIVTKKEWGKCSDLITMPKWEFVSLGEMDANLFFTWKINLITNIIPSEVFIKIHHYIFLKKKKKHKLYKL